MKKSLLAIAAMTAFVGAAHAQSSVTVYGIMDAGVLSVNNTAGSSVNGANNKTTGVQSGGLSSPRIGFKGSEDLGGGMKAVFNLEAEVLTATGQTNGVGSNTSAGASQAENTNGQFFNRASWVGLADKKYGEIRLGLQNTSNYNNIVSFDALQGTNLGAMVNMKNGATATASAGDSFSNNFGRSSNAIGYISPTFAGFQATFLQGNAQQSGSAAAVRQPDGALSASYRQTDYGLNYTFQKLKLAASYATVSNATGTSDTQISTAGTSLMGLYASYDLGVAKLFATRVATTGQGTNGSTNTYNTFGVRAPVAPKITVAANFAQSVASSSYNNANGNMTSVSAEYAMSKRTTLYALGSISSNEANGRVQIASGSKFSNATAGANGLNQTGYMVGVRHSF